MSLTGMLVGPCEVETHPTVYQRFWRYHNAYLSAIRSKFAIASATDEQNTWENAVGATRLT